MMSSGDQPGAPKDRDLYSEIIRLLEADHDATIAMIARLASVRDALIGLAFSATGILVGVAFSSDSWQLAAAGVPVVLLFALLEARNRFLHVVLQNRVSRLERRLQAYVDSLIERGRPLQAEAERRLLRELDGFEFGVGRSLRYPSTWKALGVAVRTPSLYLYIALAVVLGVSAAAIS
jgi:hypothetical protein